MPSDGGSRAAFVDAAEPYDSELARSDAGPPPTNLGKSREMSEVSRWTIFSLLDTQFVHRVRFAVVFGNAANEAIIVTVDDEVYGLGTNACSCLGICNGFGLGNGQSSLDPARIEPLCNKQIINMAFGSGPHVVALTENGDMYSWGHNGHCQLGNGNSNPGLLPSLISSSSLSGRRVIQVACGNHHSLAVTDQGEVFAWGDNSHGQIGIGSTVNQPTPKKITRGIGGKFIKSVCCGQDSSMAITSTGELYCWGNNSNGQLGLGNIQHQSSPCRVLELRGLVVSQVVAGFAHSLALTDEGILYAWGSNSCGQLGHNTRANQLIPTGTAKKLGRIIEIAAVHACNITAVHTQTNKVFMWGQVRGQSIVRPQETRFQCVDDVFACFATPAVSWRPISFALRGRDTIEESVRTAFDDSHTADVLFNVEGRTIHAHKAILKIRCHHFRSMFQTQWTEGNGGVVDIPHHSYAVFRAFLAYLYTDRVDIPPEDAVGLLDLANSYCEETLKEKCTEIIRRGITVENASMLYAAAVKFSAEDLEEFCFQFCLNHMTAITQTEAFLGLDETSVKHFIRQAAKRGAFKH